jgi:hypothetical protein
MKTIILTAAAAFALIGPAFANSPADFAEQHFAQSHEPGDGPRTMVDTSTGNVDFVLAHFAQDRETGDGPRIREATPSSMVVSSSNTDLTAFAKAKLDNDERGDN